jgi:hypothetical protein
VSAFERHAVQLLVDRARAAGVEVPKDIERLCTKTEGSGGAMLWAAAHPDYEDDGCCWGTVLNGPEGCLCWVPVFEAEQRPPRPPQCAEDLSVQRRMCGDCAFRRDSPERADEWSEQALFDLAASSVPFWCHQGMRRPVRWEHPDGRTIGGSMADWQPPMVSGIPYQADGTPGLLCAGWAARAARTAVT